ncbi:MAG: SatD family protein [Verrucomicrobiota bacterium]
MHKLRTILMADVIKSSKQDQSSLMAGLKAVVQETNREIPNAFLSPLTITLGDEFQSVPHSLAEAVQAIFQIEETIIRKKQTFKLRYVLSQGEIDTPINRKVAYEMLGSGLTEARELLNASKRGGRRFHINLREAEIQRSLTDAFFVFQAIIDKWRVDKDYGLITEFLAYRDYKAVADRLEKTRSQIYKRSKTLMTEEYFAIKSLINHLVQRK